MNWYDKSGMKRGQYGIKNLMLYIVVLNAAVFLMYFLDKSNPFIIKLLLIPAYVKEGEIWRLITYLFIPPTFSPLWLLFVLYFYHMIGSSLEHEWGVQKFNIYYLIGMLGTTAAAFFTGGIGTAVYLNLSLVLAFAYIFPNYQIVIFFMFPVKMKYLAWVYTAFLIYSFIGSSVSGKLAIIMSLVNFFIFFGRSILLQLKMQRKAINNRRSYKAKLPGDFTMHRCVICGKTEKDDKNEEFRYCNECDGDYEYCMQHLNSHEHVK